MIEAVKAVARGRPRSDESRAAILDAAYWRVLELGYASVTTEEIARAAGAGKQTLYRWWPSKPAIVLEAFLTKARDRIDRPLEAAVRSGDLVGVLKSQFASGRSFEPTIRLLVAEAQSDPALLRELRTRVFEPRAEVLRTTLTAAEPDEARREILVIAIDGAIWRRTLLGEPLDESFARALASLSSRAASS